MAGRPDKRKSVPRTKDDLRRSVCLAVAAVLLNPAWSLAASNSSTSTPHAGPGSPFPGGSKPSAYGPAVPPAPPAAVVNHPAPQHPAPQPRAIAPQRTSAPPRPVAHANPVAPRAWAAPRSTPPPIRYFEPREPQQYSERAYLAQQPRPQPGYAPPHGAQNESRAAYVNNQPNRSNGDHLPQWLRQHQNESPADQERALRQEPGFNRLSPQQQQDRINTLHRLNSMSPEQRERTLMRMENFERLTPQMKDAVRSSTQQLSYMQPDRKRLWQKAFRDLREMPPEQRQAVMRSPEFAGQFSAQERSIMGNLLLVEPYQYSGPPPPQPQYGKQ